METVKFIYEKINLNNLNHINCLKKLWNDPTTKKYFYTFSSQLSFESFITELGRSPYATFNDRIISLNEICLGWVTFGIYETNNIKGVTLSYAILEGFRKKGFGKLFLIDFINSLNVDEAILEVHFDNIAGEALVNSLGFEKYGIDEDDGVNKYRLEVVKLKERAK